MYLKNVVVIVILNDLINNWNVKIFVKVDE